MDLFGIGPLELLFVLLVATLVLGPARMIELARNLGKYWSEAQRLLRETADAATEQPQATIPSNGKGQHVTGPPEPDGSIVVDGTSQGMEEASGRD